MSSRRYVRLDLSSTQGVDEVTTLATGHPIDLPRLLETRLLVQANSGGGKSWALRRILEQTAPKVQQLVIDPEGEFATLREKFDYIVCAPHDADAVAHPRTAKLLARRLLETGVSAILDIYDLKPQERKAFVRHFCDALVDAPKKLWHPVLIVLDEAHVYAPEKGKSESLGAVIDLATRGRKRGFCLVAATQRLAKLHKDVAAELNNKMIGRTGLDVDVSRAADELGMTKREAMQALKFLDAGEWHVFGPALSRSVKKLKVGPVQTTHPKVGERLIAAPPEPSAKVRKVLAELADLPQQAEEEARTLEDLKRQVAESRRAERAAEKRAQAAGVPESEVQRRIKAAVAEARANAPRVQSVDTARARRLLEQAIATLGESPTEAQVPRAPRERQAPPPPVIHEGNGSLPRPKQNLLDQLAWLELHGVYPVRKETLAAVAGVSPTSGGYFNNLGGLRSAGLIDYPKPGTVAFTDAGRELAHIPDDDRPVHERWLSVVTNPQQTILRALIDMHPTAISKDELAERIGVSPTSGGYFNNLGRLRTLGAVDYPQPGYVHLTRHVMPE